MNKLELFHVANGAHFFIMQEGVQRQQLDFTSENIDDMYIEAMRLMDTNRLLDGRLRIYDASHTVVKSGEMTVSYETLKRWTAKAA